MTETLRHREAFEHYYRLGECRSLGLVARECKVSEKSVAAWSKHFGWQQRVIDRDAEIARSLRDRTDSEVLAERLRVRRVIRDAIGDFACGLATMARGYAGELERREEYTRFVLAFSEAVGVDTEKTQSAFERILPKGLLAGGAAATLLALGAAADAAGSGAEVADVVGHGFDLMDGFEAVGTLGLSVLLSLWARAHMARKTRDKEAELSRLTEEGFVRGRLAHALMTPGGLDCVREELERLRAVQADRTGGEVA